MYYALAGHGGVTSTMPSNLIKPPPMVTTTPPPATVVKPPLKANPVLPKVWITKYALTKGVYTAENVVHSLSISSGMIVIHYQTPGGYTSSFCIHKPYWHETEDEARAQVVRMVERKMKALMKQKHKLNAVLASVEGAVPTKPWT